MLATLTRLAFVSAAGRAASSVGKSRNTTSRMLVLALASAYHSSSGTPHPEKVKPPHIDPAIQQLMRDNRQWVETKNKENPEYFEALGRGQQPDFLYIGCSDSRVGISSLTGLDLGHVFVHRNIANMVGTSIADICFVLWRSKTIQH